MEFNTGVIYGAVIQKIYSDNATADELIRRARQLRILREFELIKKKENPRRPNKND